MPRKYEPLILISVPKLIINDPSTGSPIQSFLRAYYYVVSAPTHNHIEEMLQIVSNSATKIQIIPNADIISFILIIKFENA